MLAASQTLLPDPRPQWSRWFWPLCIVGLLLRLWFCYLLPKNTGDLARHLMYGQLIWVEGLGVIDRPLNTLPYYFPVQVWEGIPYSYPFLAALFFALVAKISPTMFFGKIALTAIEAANACFVWRLTRERWMVLIYWLAPLSLWWVSREGQFEPVQNFFALLALLHARRRPAAACALLAFAVQVKLTALALLPWLMVLAWRRGRFRELTFALMFFIAGFFPSFIANFYYPAFAEPFAYTATLYYNPYYWNLFNRGIFQWNPIWLVAANAAASFYALWLLVAEGFKSKDRAAYIAPLLFIFFAKGNTKFQFWYWLVWPTMILAIPDEKIRRRLWIVYLILDLSAIVAMVIPKFGELVKSEFFTEIHPFAAILKLPPP